MSDPSISIAHLSDLHFGGYADLAQIEALETFLPTLGAAATVVSGDVSQRARHGEFQAAHAFLQRLRQHAPVLVIPGNHDIEWWRARSACRAGSGSTRSTRGTSASSRRRSRSPGRSSRRAQQLRGGVRIAHLEPEDVAVKGHLPASETTRVTGIFAQAPADAVRILTFHHNIFAGGAFPSDGARQLALRLSAAARERRRRGALRP